METGLARLMCFQWEANLGGNIHRLLDADKLSDMALIIDIVDKRADLKYVSLNTLQNAFLSNQAVKVQDPYLYLMQPDAAFMPKSIAKRDTKWKRVQPYLVRSGIFSEQVRRQIIVEAQHSKESALNDSPEKRNIPSENSLYETFRRYFQRGMTPNAFIPDYGDINQNKPKRPRKMGKAPLGRPRKYNKNRPPAPFLASEAKEAMKKHYKKYYATTDALGNTLTLRQVYKKMLKDLYRFSENSDGTQLKKFKGTLPTWDQWLDTCHRKRNRRDVLRGRTDSADFSNNNRPALGNSTAMSKGPWYLLQMDSTDIHVRLVSAIDRLTPVGMAKLFLIADVYSRVIVGFSLQLKAASWESASAAIYCMMTSKIPLFEKYGIEATDEDIPCGVGERILADRSEMEGYQASVHLNPIGTDIDTTSPKLAAMKGIIEVLQKLILKDTNTYPGASKGPRKRGSIDPDKMAVLTIDDLYKIILKRIVEYNRRNR